MKFKLLGEKAYEIRKRFNSEFLLSPAEFYEKYGDGYSYDSIEMWSKMREKDISEIYFAEALAYLSAMKSPVLLMSEGVEYPYCYGIIIDGKEHKGFVAQADPKELAKLLEYEWVTQIRMFAQNMYMEETLPRDIYVFEPDLNRMLVFTHEKGETYESRICLAYGFCE